MAPGNNGIGDWLFAVLRVDGVDLLEDDGLGGDVEMVDLYGTILEADNGNDLFLLLCLMLDIDGMHLNTGDLLYLCIGYFEFPLVKQTAFLKGHQADGRP